jgi:NADH-quinone oxidoreductase subunit F
VSLPILSGPEGWPSVLLARATQVDPEAGIAAAEAAGAWEAYRSVVTERSPEALIALVSEAGLQGRGGAGYPAGRKWRDCAAQPGGQRHVVANGFEADPGAQVDRTLMELDPHAVVEGTALAAFAVEAEEAIIAVRASAPLAVARLRRPIADAGRRAYLGEKVLGTRHRPRIEVR